MPRSYWAFMEEVRAQPAQYALHIAQNFAGESKKAAFDKRLSGDQCGLWVAMLC